MTNFPNLNNFEPDCFGFLYINVLELAGSMKYLCLNPVSFYLCMYVYVYVCIQSIFYIYI